MEVSEGSADIVINMPTSDNGGINMLQETRGGFFRRMFHRRRSEPAAPVEEAASMYPGYLPHQSSIAATTRAQSVTEDDILTKTTVKMESVMLLVNATRHPVRVIKNEEKDGLTLIFFVDSLVPFLAEVSMQSGEKLSSLSFEKGIGQEIRLDLSDHPRTTTNRYTLILHSTEEVPAIAGENRMISGTQLSTVIVNESSQGSLDAKIEAQRIQIGSFEMDLLEIYGQPQQATKAAGREGNKSSLSLTSFFTGGSNFDAPGVNRECVVCLSQRRDTLFLPCRHMCLCLPCAESLCIQSDKCPICRQGKSDPILPSISLFFL